MVHRKVTYRLYPTTKQENALLTTLRLHQQLYNAALEERIGAYKKRKISLSYVDQAKKLTELRANCPEYKALNAQSEQVTLTRLDLAYQHFFRRVKSGEEQVGFPRFKSLDRYPGWGYKTHGDGWKLVVGNKGKHGALRISGVGQVKIRGQARNSGTPKTMEVLCKQDRWYASVTFVTTPERSNGTAAIGLDWGLETYATIVSNEGATVAVENPRTLRKQLKVLKTEQRSLSKKKRGSKNRNRSRLKVARLHAKVANQRKEFLHQTTAQLVKTSALIAVEQLNVKNMTASGGAYKKGLNREILSAAPSGFHQMLKYKAAVSAVALAKEEEAGVEWIEIPTRQVKPSQTCHMCGRQEKKSLATRMHVCICDCMCSRDKNAAHVILNWALTGKATGWEPTRCGGETIVAPKKHETPTITALAV